MSENDSPKRIFSAGYGTSLKGVNNETNSETVLFYEKEPDGTSGASNIYIIAEGTPDTWRTEAASRFCAKKVLYEFLKSHEYIDANKLALSIRKASNELFDYSQAIEEKMGTNLTAISITEGIIVVGTVGECSVFIVRNGKVYQITDPNKRTADDQEKIEALGFEQDVVIDIYEGIEVKPDDVVLILSQGMLSYIGKKEILDAVNGENARVITESLIECAQKMQNKNDVSVAVVKIYDEDTIGNVVRNTGNTPADTDVNAEMQEYELKLKSSSGNVRPNRNKQSGFNLTPWIIAAILILMALSGLLIWLLINRSARKDTVLITETSLVSEETQSGDDVFIVAMTEAVDENAFTVTEPTEVVNATTEIINLDATVETIPTPTSESVISLVNENDAMPTEGVNADNPNIDVIETDSIPTDMPAEIDTTSAVVVDLTDQDSISIATEEVEEILPTVIPTAASLSKENIFNEIDGAEMVYIPAGEFKLGANVETDEYAYLEENLPQIQVYLDAFWIDKLEVTNEKYAQCVQAGACEENAYMQLNDPSVAEQPVTYVSWESADAYCKWAGKRLPTEVEWEKAAKGTGDTLFPWGDEEPGQANRLANFPYFIDSDSGQGPGILNAGSLPDGASPYGALDMAGNVWEWTSSRYSSDYYQRLQDEAEETGEPIINPQGDENGMVYVIRGGSASEAEVYYYEQYLRSTYRGFVNMSSSYYIGFRCAMGE